MPDVRYFVERQKAHSNACQMAFVHSQLNVWGKQATDLASLYSKAAEDAAKERAGGKKS